MNTAGLFAGMLALAIFTAPSHVHAEDWKLTTGADYTNGDYGGTNDISTLYVPVTGKFRGERVGLRVTVPYVQVSGPGTIVDTAGQLIPGPDRTDGGLGDVIVAGTLYDIVALREQRFYIDLTAKAKFGTADETKGLGTGENDYSLQGEWYKDFERVGLFGSVGYKVYGDPPGTDFENAAYASLGSDFGFTRNVRAGLIFDYRESAVRGGDALQELTLFASISSSNGMSLQPYVLGGLSDSSPDLGAGIMVSWKTNSH